MEFDDHLWKNAEAIHGRPGGHIREQSTRSMLRYSVRTGLTLEIEQEDLPAEWKFLGHRSYYKVTDGSRRWTSLEECTA